MATSEGRRRRDAAKRGRVLSLRIVVNAVPRGVTRPQLVRRLLECIEEGDYWLPSGWDVEVWWRNGPDQEWRHDPWPVAMSESASNGRGFDRAMERYLELQMIPPSQRGRG